MSSRAIAGPAVPRGFSLTLPRRSRGALDRDRACRSPRYPITPGQHCSIHASTRVGRRIRATTSTRSPHRRLAPGASRSKIAERDAHGQLFPTRSIVSGSVTSAPRTVASSAWSGSSKGSRCLRPRADRRGLARQRRRLDHRDRRLRWTSHRDGGDLAAHRGPQHVHRLPAVRGEPPYKRDTAAGCDSDLITPHQSIEADGAEVEHA